MYRGDNLAAGSVPPSRELLQEKLLVLGYEVLHKVIDKDPLRNGHEIMHTKFWIPTIVDIEVALC